jgi:hypothetical protein
LVNTIRQSERILSEAVDQSEKEVALKRKIYLGLPIATLIAALSVVTGFARLFASPGDREDRP